MFGAATQLVERLNECSRSKSDQLFVPLRCIKYPLTAGGQEEVGVDEKRESSPRFGRENANTRPSVVSGAVNGSATVTDVELTPSLSGS